MLTGSILTVLVTSCLLVSSGAQKITKCQGGHVDAEENKIITLRCEEYDDMKIVTWKIGKDMFVLAPVASCAVASSTCVVTGVQGADRTSTYGDVYSNLYLNVTRSLDNKTVVCEYETETGMSQSLPCILNVTATVSSGTTSPSSSDSPTTGTAIKSHQDKNQTDVPVEAIVGGAVAAVVVIVIVIVVVVVVIIVRRKRNREHSGKENSHEQQVHYNPENGTGVALEPSQNADGDTSAGPPEFGIYAFPGGEEAATIPDNTPAAEEDDVGMYAAPTADVYAAVDKSKQKKNKPSTSDHLATSEAANVGDEYAVVNKASKTKEASNSTGISDAHIPDDAGAAPAPYIYAQVDKTAKRAKTAVSVSKTPEEEGATYAQVQKPKKK